ncbi:DinB superfamily [Rothia aeria]|uniref:DinB superfamily n=1 Tax=Rothia aeria TaxID=172042 RepID=A0A7Z9D7G5_9MICC|nr:DinB family protein [Rothia aeria]VEI24472.1 DinB superfamily [Rothia aeria]
MDARDVLSEAASRPATEAKALVDTLPAGVLNAHAGGHTNSIAWLLWHAGRQMDVQLAQLNGEPQVWHSQGFDARFNLSELGDTVGYGHTAEQARAVVVEDAALLAEYLGAATAALSEYIAGLSEADLDDVIDTSWTPHVTRGVRLVSMIDDAAQHVGQAAYATGILASAAGSGEEA